MSDKLKYLCVCEVAGKSLLLHHSGSHCLLSTQILCNTLAQKEPKPFPLTRSRVIDVGESHFLESEKAFMERGGESSGDLGLICWKTIGNSR